MRNKDTGEFELVVGDKQLLSGCFIGVLLLAVVFAMGYVLGRGTPRSATVAPETAAVPANTATQPAAQAVTPTTPATDTSPASTPVLNPDVEHPAEAPAAEPQPQPTTVPAKDAASSAPAPAPPPKAEPAPPPAEPANGTYWQVLAGSQSSAEALAKTLKGQGFHVITRSGRDNLTLVWVGPYADKPSLSHAKKQLEDAGITNLYKKP